LIDFLKKAETHFFNKIEAQELEEHEKNRKSDLIKDYLLQKLLFC